MQWDPIAVARASYQAYVDRYFRGSWEEAIAMWWGEKRVKS